MEGAKGRLTMNATLGEIALNHALSHDTPVDDVILENVEGAADAVAAHQDGASAPQAQRAQNDSGEERSTQERSTQERSTQDRSQKNGSRDDRSKEPSTEREQVKTAPHTLRERAEAFLAQAEELARENPRKALAIAAGAGLVVGVSLLSVPVLRTVAKRAALSAIKGGGVAGLGSELGGQALEKLEGLLSKK